MAISHTRQSAVTRFCASVDRFGFVFSNLVLLGFGFSSSDTKILAFTFLNVCEEIHQLLSGIEKDAHKRILVLFFCITV